MVGVMVPIAVEGSRMERKAHTARRASATPCVRPLLKKNSKSRLRTFQVSISVETPDNSAPTTKPQLVKRGSVSKMVLPWDTAVAQQVQQVHQARRQSTVRLSNGFSRFQLEALEEHNMFRERHGVRRLELRKELCEAAQQYADTLAATDLFQHSGDIMYGENLYWSWSSQSDWVPTGREAVASWYSEGSEYDYSLEPPPDSPAGHFTQLVWAGTTAMGVGLTAVPARAGKWVIVVKYDPPGNWLGQYTANVWEPRMEE